MPVAQQIVPNPQAYALNRQDSPFVPLVGESAARLANIGFVLERIDTQPISEDVNRVHIRVRRDLVGRLGEFRAFVAEGPRISVVSVAFVPKPNLDLGIFGTEIVYTPAGTRSTFGVHAGGGTWFAGQHAYHSYQEVRRYAPNLVPDDAEAAQRARQRGFMVQVNLKDDALFHTEGIHRTLWASYMQSLQDALELDMEGKKRNAGAIEAWKAHKRSMSLIARVLMEHGATHAHQVHADVITA